MGSLSKSFKKIKAFFDQVHYFECLQIDVILYFAMKGHKSRHTFIKGDSLFPSGLDENKS